MAVATCDIGGSHLSLRNEWDEDVIVRATTLSSLHSVRVPPSTWGNVFSAWDGPTGEIEVFDSSCRLLASFPFERSGPSVWVDPDGRVEFTDDDGPLAEGVTRADAPFEEAHCR